MSKQEQDVKKNILNTFFEEEEVKDDKSFLVLLVSTSIFVLFSLGCTFYGYMKFIQWIIQTIKTIF